MTHPASHLRLLLYVLACVSALGGGLLQPERLAAQTCEPTELTCQEPPGVSITPSGGSWTGTAQSMVLQVQVEFCRSGGLGPFSSGSETFTLDGNPQSFTAGTVANGCFTSTGNVTLTVGSHTFTASKASGSVTGTASATYDYALPPPVPGVAVTPHGDPVKRPGSYGATEAFTVANPGTGPGSYTLQAACAGAAVSCTATRATVDLAAGATASVGVNYVPSGAQGATGTVSLKAWLTATPTTRDSGAYALTVDTLGLRGKQGLRPDMRRLDRDVCVTVAAAPGAAFECGDLRLAHGLPGVRLLNRSRAPTLVYSSQHAAPQPLFVAYVAPQAGTRPDTIRAVLTVNGVNYPARWPGWPSDTVKRIAVPLPTALATGVYAYTLTVTGTWNNGAPTQSIYSATSEFVTVNRQASPFGSGWWLAGLEQLVPAGNRWVWIGGDGSHHVYSPVAGTSDRWVADTYDRPDTLKRVGDLLVRRLPGGTEVRYDLYGYHYQTVDPVGKATTFVWSAGHAQLVRIDLPLAGYAYQFSYGNEGGTRLSSVSSPGVSAALTTTVATDGTGRVTQITDPDTRFVAFGYTGADPRVMKRTDRRNWTSRFLYGEGSRLTGTRVPAAVGDTLATTFRAEEGQGVATAAVSAYTYMSGPRPGVTTSWVLDSYGAPYRLAEPIRGDTYIYRGDPRFPGLVTRVDHPNGRTLTASYDARGNVTASTDWATSGGGRYATTLYEWDAACDLPTRVTAPEGEVTTRAYTAFCAPQWVRPAGEAARQVTFAYRALNDTLAPGQIASTTWPQLAGQSAAPQETYEYDARGNLAAVTSPLGATLGSRSESYADAIGRDTLTRVRITGTLWERTRHVYDVMGRDTLTETIGPELNGQAEQRRVVRTRHDDGGNVLSVLRQSVPDAAGLDSVVTRFAYDGVGRVVRETAPDGLRDTTAYDPGGNVVWTQSRRGLQSWMQYDALSRLTRRITDSVRYAPVTREVRLLTNRGLVGSSTFPVYPNAAAGVLRLPTDTATFTYDGMGNLLTADNRDARIRRTYGINGRMTSDTLRTRTWAELSAGGSFSHVYGLQFAYDLNGRRVQMTHPGTVAPVNAGTGAAYTQQTYGYDPATGSVARITSVLGLNYRFFYNLHGQADSIAYNDQTGEKLGYDLDGRPATRRVAGANFKTSAGVERIHDLSLTYGDRRGKVTTVDDNGIDQADLSMTYSGLGMLLGMTGDAGVPGSGVNHFVESYRYDALGNRVTWHAGQTAGDLSYANYERLTGRLITTHPPTTTIYSNDTPQADSSSYDAGGNVAWYNLNSHSGKMFALTRNYYGADETLRASERWTCTVTNTQVINYGNVSAECLQASSLNSVTGGAFEDYRYDALGRRVLVRTRRAPYCTSLSCPNTITRTVWDGDEILYEIRSGGDSATATLENDAATGSYLGRVAYTHGPGIDRPLDLMRMGFTLQASTGEDFGFNAWGGPYPIIPIGNWRGTVDDAVTAAGRMVPCQASCTVNIHLPGNSYQSWFTPSTEANRTSWFGSLIEDKLDATGQMYMRNRYYNPNTGIFTQEDPIGLGGGINVYGFAGGDPVSYGDPYGLSDCKLGQDCWEAFKEGTRSMWQTWSNWVNSGHMNADVQSLMNNAFKNGGGVALMGVEMGFTGPVRVRAGASAAEREATLLTGARTARDALANDLASGPASRRPATVTAGYNIRTGQVAARACGGGHCAEDMVVGALGGNRSEIRFTEAVRPRASGNRQVPVCERCEGRYGRGAFPPGTQFKSDQ